MSTKLISTAKLASFALALGVTAVVHLGVWECAAANAWQVVRDTEAERVAPSAPVMATAQPVPTVTITALRPSLAHPHAPTA